MCLAQLHVGGLVAVGTDPTEGYLMTVSHSGRGVYDTENWQRVARDYELAYPVNGKVSGIGPLADVLIPVTEIDYDTSSLAEAKVGESFLLSYSEGDLLVRSTGT